MFDRVTEHIMFKTYFVLGLKRGKIVVRLSYHSIQHLISIFFSMQEKVGINLYHPFAFSIYIIDHLIPSYVHYLIRLSSDMYAGLAYHDTLNHTVFWLRSTFLLQLHQLTLHIK